MSSARQPLERSDELRRRLVNLRQHIRYATPRQPSPIDSPSPRKPQMRTRASGPVNAVLYS
ncbi:hypothetical protein FKP32DRAFT_1673250 [Trametes sanguinea]|nr:hypothetical protein FKP32DRAFT_1673250 [Trametes sanguinea]